jgi:phytoene desaturase
MGPSWYLMPDVFERFFAHFGRVPADYYDLEHLDPHYRVFFKEDRGGMDRRTDGGLATTAPEGSRVLGDPGPFREASADVVDVDGDRERMHAIFESYEASAGDAFEDYLNEARRAYEVGMEHFVYTDRGRFRDYLDWDVLCNARGLGLLGSMSDHVAETFEHRKLRQLVQYSLVFLGGSPQNTPALYKLMSHVDFGLGVHYPDGGMSAVVDALVSLGDSLGVRYETGAAVDRIEGERGDFRVVSDRRAITADVVLSNAGYAHTERSLLAAGDRQYDEAYWADRTWAPSAYLLYLGVEGDLDALAHHTLVLPEDWDPHFAAIFDEPAWPADPAYYCCVPSETDESVAPAGHSTLFVLCPIAPGLEDGSTARDRLRELLLADLAHHTGVDVRDRIVCEEDFCIAEFAERYNAPKGTALGLAHTLRQTGPLRPGHRSSALEGLYYAGADTRPGIGVPMSLISGEHAANAVLADAAGASLP